MSGARTGDSLAVFKNGFEMATPIRWSAYNLAQFCTSSGYSVLAVSRGSMFIPPATNEFSDLFDSSRERLEKLFPRMGTSTHCICRCTLQSAIRIRQQEQPSGPGGAFLISRKVRPLPLGLGPRAPPNRKQKQTVF